MAGMSWTYNLVAAMLFCAEAAVSLGHTNPECITKCFEWLPKRKDILFEKCDKQSRRLVTTPSKNYHPLVSTSVKPLSVKDIAKSLKNVFNGQYSSANAKN